MGELVESERVGLSQDHRVCLWYEPRGGSVAGLEGRFWLAGPENLKTGHALEKLTCCTFSSAAQMLRPCCVGGSSAAGSSRDPEKKNLNTLNS